MTESLSCKLVASSLVPSTTRSGASRKFPPFSLAERKLTRFRCSESAFIASGFGFNPATGHYDASRNVRIRSIELAPNFKVGASLSLPICLRADPPLTSYRFSSTRGT